MAVVHRKEEKIQAVLGRLPKKYSPDDFVAMFIKLYSNDWGKIKSAYIKASQDKEPGTVINMPKPDLYLKQVLEIFLTQKASTTIETPKEEVIETEPVIVKAVKSKAIVKKANVEETVTVVKKAKTEEKPVIKTKISKASVKKTEEVEPIAPVKKVRAVAKKKID